MNKHIKSKTLLLVFFYGYLFCYGQKEIKADYIKKTITDSLYNGNVILFEHNRGKLHLRFSDYLKQKKYKISDIKFNKNTIGDFNDNGITDFFGTIRIKRWARNELYICLFELNDDTITIYNYFEMGPYSKLSIKGYKNDTLNIHTQKWGREGQVYIDRLVSIVHDEKNIIKIVTPSKFDEMKNINIFKDSIKNIKRESFINNSIIRSQYESYFKKNISIESELSGFDNFNLRFTVLNKDIVKDFEKTKFILQTLEFLESNTRFPTILTKIEKKILTKKEDKLSISDKMRYNIKNYINSNTYFIVGEYRLANDYLFDIIYVEEN
ncbi:hypothetical protein [Aquimarina aquimarini]|uniref:hypothetical protein n=1 Tax=Aquimarina aquimarini TaxID=1191734 RepID=UPI000D54E3FA|nr:hypothetical protein [Aquimarina aquimarini]